MKDCWTEKITIKDLAIFLGNSGILDTLTDANIYTKEQVQDAVNSAIEMYELLMPCLCKKAFFEKYRNLALSHIAIILTYNINKNANAEQNETKSRVEREYNDLLNEFRDGGLYDGFCNKLIETDEDEDIPQFNIMQSGTFNPMGRNDANVGQFNTVRIVR